MPPLSSTVDLTQPITQAAFGRMVGIGQSAVASLVASGVLVTGEPAITWLRSYLARLQSNADERHDGAFVAERVRLTRERADQVAMQNAQRRREVVPVPVLEAVLAHVLAQLLQCVTELEDAIRRKLPDAPEAMAEIVREKTDALRQVIAHASISKADELDAELRQAEAED